MRGLAISAVAAGVLAEEAGIPAETVAKFFDEAAAAATPTLGLRPGEVVVVDEAGMVPTADLAALVEAVAVADAKLVLVGDHRQLGAVDAGGLFRLLVADSGAAELTEVRRFTQGGKRRRLATAPQRRRLGPRRVRPPRPDHRRHPRRWSTKRSPRWRAARAAGESDRRGRPRPCPGRRPGHAGPGRPGRSGRSRTRRDRRRRQVVGSGDEIVTTRNDRRLVTTTGVWVRNGDRWRVDERRADGALVVSHLDGHGRVVLPAGYTAEHVALAYAVTVHKAEGMTVDRAVLVADAATTGEHLYVGMTRGRHENRVCVVTDAATTGHGHRRPPTPVEVLTAAMHRSSAEVSATETLRQELGARRRPGDPPPALGTGPQLHRGRRRPRPPPGAPPSAAAPLRPPGHALGPRCQPAKRGAAGPPHRRHSPGSRRSPSAAPGTHPSPLVAAPRSRRHHADRPPDRG